MPLDNTASIKDIITSLQSMEGINAKADLASVIGSPATQDDTMATMINEIQTAKNELAIKTGQVNTEPLQSLVENMVVGKKWASGTINIVNSRTLTVNDLPFAPRLVVAYHSTNPDPNNAFGYRSGTTSGFGTSSSGGATYSQNVTFGDNSFSLILSNLNLSNANYTWLAFE